MLRKPSPFRSGNAEWSARVAQGQAALAPGSVKVAEFLAMPEPDRLAKIKSAAAIPDRCGPDIASAPARGAFALYSPREMVPGSTERQRHAGWQGRDAIRAADVFDRMEGSALAAHLRAGGAREVFDPPFDPGQVQMARHYRDLVERHDGGGFRCASVEAGRSGGAPRGEFIDAFVHEGQEIARLVRAIGPGLALTLRRQTEGRGLKARSAITCRALVDHVCLRDRTPGEVLEAYGWAAWKEPRETLRRALADALDRMRGYR